MSRVVPVLVLLSACGTAPEEIEREDFAYWMADVWCDRTRECMRGTYEATYFDQADCQETNERAWDSVVEAMDELECDYNSGKAGEAWVDIAEMSCENFYEGEATEAMSEIWEDCPVYTYTTDYTYYGY